jgi:uncharacterized protein (TIGR03435 family)
MGMKSKLLAATGISVLLLLSVGEVRAQTASGKRAQFEVATVKPEAPQAFHFMDIKIEPGGGLVITSRSLRGLLLLAFGLSTAQVTGGDAWTRDNLYDIEAKPSENVASQIKTLRHSQWGIDDELIREMLQSLLIERFQLQFHIEKRTGTVYMLQQGGRTMKMQPAKTPVTSDPSRAGYGEIGRVGGKWSIINCTMAQLARFAADNELHVPVLDHTELTGTFDYKQPVGLEAPSDENYSDFITNSFLSFVSELGLKLERTKEPVETFVIDRAVPAN